MVSQAQAVALFLFVTAGIGAAVYYVVDMKGLDPLRLFGDDADESHDAALAQALVSALDSKSGGRGGSGALRSRKALGPEDASAGAPALVEEETLDGLLTDRLKRQHQAKQHARETVAAVVEEMTQVREEETKKDKEVDEDDDAEPKDTSSKSTGTAGLPSSSGSKAS